MSWLFKALSSSVGQKFVMGLTGLLLCTFLIVHLGGNLLMYSGDGSSYTEYAKKLHEQPLLWVAEVGLFSLFGLHIFLAFTTIRRNRAARNQSYAVKKSKKPGGLMIFDSSYFMPLSGFVILGFLIVHLNDFKFMDDEKKVGDAVTFEAVRDLLSMSVENSGHVLPVYLAGSIMLGLHLSHGVSSAFQSLGCNHPKYERVLKLAGVLFALAIAVGFASFPVWAWMSGPSK